MRISLRLIFSLIVGVTLLSVVFAIFQQRAEKRGLRNDLAKRTEILAESLGANFEPLLATGSRRNMQKIVTRFGNRERVAGIAVFDKSGNRLAITPGLETYFNGQLATVSRVIADNASYGGFITLDQKPTYLYVLPLQGKSGVEGALAIFNDASFIERQTARQRREIYLRVLAQTLFIVLTTVLIIRWSILRPSPAQPSGSGISRQAREGHARALTRTSLSRWQQEVTHLAKSLEQARAAAEEEARLRRDCGVILDAGAPSSPRPQQAGRPAALCRLQPRTLHARLSRQGSGSCGPGQWLGHSTRTHFANLRGNLVGARFGRRRPRSSGRGIACESRPTIPNTR